ncbi:hypothetical protein N566_19895 [Streptomycetaceae bacterium MP113-05]|nr:hypothetical protein N566_19895 [Streptomycetaceae bacterium MP113-05]
MPGGPAPGRDSNKTVAVIAAAVAVLLIVGCGVWFLTRDSGDSDPQGGTTGTTQGTTGGDSGGSTGGGGNVDGGHKPAGTEGRLLFSVDAPKVDDITSVPGMWATEDLFVKTGVEAILGLKASDGSEAWKIPLDGQVCAASLHRTDDGKTAVVTRETRSSKARCNQMVVIDLVGGKKLWQQTIPNDGNVNSLGGSVTVSQGTVAAAWIGGSVGYPLSGGDPIWATETGADCRDDGYAGGAKLIAVVECGSYSKPEYIVQTLDPKTGEAEDEFKVPGRVRTLSVASTDPLVLVIGAGESTPSDIMTVSDDMKLMTKISLGSRYEVDCDLSAEGCRGILATEDALYMRTQLHEANADYGRTNEIMKFDIKTGTTKWKSSAGEKRVLTPMRFEEGKLISYRLPSYEKGGEIVAIDPADGKQTTWLKLNQTHMEEQFVAYRLLDRALFAYGRLHLQTDLLSERDDGDKPLAAVFGVG